MKILGVDPGYGRTGWGIIEFEKNKAKYIVSLSETVSENYSDILPHTRNELTALPGIGRKSATRLAFHILKLSKEEALEISDLIREVKDKVGFCSTCNNISETDPCLICTDVNRQQNIICVVEESSDAAALDKAEGFNGLFHILGGRLSPLDGIGPP